MQPQGEGCGSRHQQRREIHRRLRPEEGSETQEADPIISDSLGAANTPGYRGRSYIVFNDLQLKDYQRQIPNLEFEVVEAGTVHAGHTLINSVDTLAVSAVKGLKGSVKGKFFIAVESGKTALFDGRLVVYEKTVSGLVKLNETKPFTDRDLADVHVMDNGYIIAVFYYANTTTHRDFKTYTISSSGVLTDADISVETDYNGVHILGETSNYRRISSVNVSGCTRRHMPCPASSSHRKPCHQCAR